MTTVWARIVICGGLPAALVLTGCGGGDGAEGALSGKGVESVPVGGVDLSGAEFDDLTAEDAVAIDAVDNVFKAKYIEVKAGTTITFRNDGRNTHNVLPVEKGDFAAVEADDFEPGVETTITFDEPGEFPYYCSLHGTTTKGMVGAVRVVE